MRWFAPNRYCALPVPRLREGGLRIALEGEAPAGLAVAADGQCAVAGFEFSRRHRCPLLLYLWDLPPWRLGEGRPDHVFAVAGRVTRIRRLIGRYPERAGYYSRIAYVARRAAEVWCPSGQTTQAVRERFGLAAARMPFCYDSDRFRPGVPSPPALDRSPFTALAISRLVPHKNHAAILRAAARLDPKPGVRIIGRGPEAEPLRALARRLGVALELQEAWVPDEAIVEAYRHAGVVISASRFEGFGLTPIEAVAMGLPVLASDIPPHHEFLEELVTFFPADDDAALARAIGSAAGASRPSGIRAPLPELTIEACAERFRPGLERLLGRRG